MKKRKDDLCLTRVRGQNCSGLFTPPVLKSYTQGDAKECEIKKEVRKGLAHKCRGWHTNAVLCSKPIHLKEWN